MATIRRETYDGDGRLIASADITIPDEVANADILDNRLDQALTSLRSYRDNASPTTAQTVAVVKILCRVAIALIRQRRNLLDGTE